MFGPIFRMKPLVAVGALMVLTLVLAACGGDDPTATTAATATTPAQATADPNAAFDAEWEALIAAAKAEGTLGIAAGGQPSRTYRPLLKRFEDKYGIKVEMSTGGATDTTNRVLAERDAGKYTVDVALISVRIMNSRFLPGGALVPVAPWLIHPDILDLESWEGGQHWWGDPDQNMSFLYSVSINAAHEYWYNTEKISAEDIAGIKSFNDFLDPKFAGKIAGQGLGDPSGIRGLVNAYWEPSAGPEWVEKYLTGSDVTLVDDRRILETWLTSGRYPLVILGGNARDLRNLRKEGIPVDSASVPLELPGLQAGGSGCCLAIFDQAPHPNATKLFVNWFLSKEGQTALHETIEDSDISSLLNGIPMGLVTAEGRRDPSVTYPFPDADPGFAAKLAEGQAYAFKIWEAR